MLKKVESLIFTDESYDAAVSFFRDTLVLEMPSESNDMVRFELAGFPVFVARAKEGAAAFVTLESDDIETDYAVLQKRGVTFQEPLNTMKGGDKAAFFMGPAGMRFMLYQPAPESS
jgi:hypothetical protein